MRDYIQLLSRSWLAILGAVTTTASAVLFIVLFGIDLVSHRPSPYTGIVSFVIVPAIFVFGLLLIPAGVWIQRRKEARLTAAGKDLPIAFVLDFNQPRTLRIAGVVAALSIVNVAILAVAAYKSHEVMDSTEFCGTACHSVMAPEYTAYQRSAHSRVGCVECHIGGGASWFVKSKISGSWQLVSVALNLYPRPIPTPVHNLRPARDTCEQCHWPDKFVGDRLKIHNRYADDETTTASKTVLLLKVGGVREGGKGHGIHWHVDPRHQVRFQSDASRKKIYDVEVTQAGSETRIYKADEKAPEGTKLEWRTMDCIDCHNRPTHEYRMPEREIDDALTGGLIDRSLPFIKREGLRIIKQAYASQEAAKTGIREALVSFYREQFPEVAAKEGEKIDKTALALWDLYRVNVWPEMKIEWGSYPSNIGHEPGCFRCHNNEHKTDDDKKIGKKCTTCHEVLAEKEEEPEILEILYP